MPTGSGFSTPTTRWFTEPEAVFQSRNDRGELPLHVINLLVACLSGLTVLVSGPRVTAQPFQLLRYEENYAPDTLATGYHRLKFIPLSRDRKVYASLGGEARLNYAVFNHEDWDKASIGINRFLLQRYVLHADLHLGHRFRLFAQLRSALEQGRKNGPRPIDEDQLAVQNLFADLTLFGADQSHLTLRLGRQELNYGSGRLISVRELPNVRLYFTGPRLIYQRRKTSADGFLMMADTVKPGVFDNRASRQANLWGLYARSVVGKNRCWEYYYLGFRQHAMTYETGIAREVRHTLGTRLAKTGIGLVYNLEAAYQFGRFGNSPIRAWTVSVDLGYQFRSAKRRPLLGIRHDYISGDRNRDDGRLETFNPLYPKGGYFGFDPQIGPANLIDLHPYGTLQLSRGLQVQGDAVFNWRFSLQDGIYQPSGAFNQPGSGSRERYIGTAYLGKLNYEFNPFLSADFGLQWFQPGPFIRSLIPAATNALFTNSRVVFRF
ncbi:alginate export family protein [Larkinella sp. VNQ87]|uniref:alginate export family protein n=1 Tax=Larkinella sp. VNQ87 TaxID=3400921 RepID=UPI003C10FD97